MRVAGEVVEEVGGTSEDGCVAFADGEAGLDAPQAGVLGVGGGGAAARLAEVGFEEESETVAGAGGGGVRCFGCETMLEIGKV